MVFGILSIICILTVKITYCPWAVFWVKELPNRLSRIYGCTVKAKSPSLTVAPTFAVLNSGYAIPDELFTYGCACASEFFTTTSSNDKDKENDNNRNPVIIYVYKPILWSA